MKTGTFCALYLDTSKVECVRCTPTPAYGVSRLGYGKKIPIGWMLKIKNRWRRVYVTQYSNAGSAWVTVDKVKRYLGGYDPATAYEAQKSGILYKRYYI